MKSSTRFRSTPPLASMLCAALALCACNDRALIPDAAARRDAETRVLREKVKTIVVIYAENRAFDNLFGHFPGAHGLDEIVDSRGAPLPAYVPQRDRDGSLLGVLPQTWGGVTASGSAPIVTQAQSAGLPNAPFSIEHAFTPAAGVTLSVNTVTRDLYHRFFENQMQIDSGRNDGFAAWSDAGGLAMGNFEYVDSALFALAKSYVLADNFFQGAFGGSFLNHQYLICACAPVYAGADTAAAKPSIAVLDRDAGGHYLPHLQAAADSPPSALDGPPKFAKSGNVAPLNYFGDATFHAVNTMQPPYQPSGNAPAAADAGFKYANPGAATTLPAQSQPTIGDLLDAGRVPWAWYAGAWNAALDDGRQPGTQLRKAIYAPDTPGGAPDFQPHHQPFNYYVSFDPATHAAYRAEHLKDYADLLVDIAGGTLPPVVFYKPQGNLNQHAGYASIASGDAHIADLVRKLQAGPQWPNMVIVITYDEFGGAWDHVAPPAGDLLGPGTRIPALIVSPFARRGTVDHTQYDTASIQRLITRRFGLGSLAGVQERDRALAARGAPPMGDLTPALNLGP
jgi:acid phosphatase